MSSVTAMSGSSAWAGSPLTLGYFAPLPPSPSGVADYAAVMLSHLRAHGEVRVNEGGHINLYHVGNNRLHASILSRALEEPGMVILHDALLQHLFLGLMDETTYVTEFVYNYGEWNRPLAATLWQRRASAMGDLRYFRYPMLRRLAERSRLMVVHGEAARRAVLAHCPSAQVAMLPHLTLELIQPVYWVRPERAVARDHFRQEVLHLAPGELLLGVFGFLRESKRLSAVLRALDRLRAGGLPVRLLVAGSFASEDYQRTWLPRLRSHPAVLLSGPSNAPSFRQLLEAVDVCVNLKYPSAGESSGIAARALALGVPLVLNQGPALAATELPEGTFAPVQMGPGEEASLQYTLEWLLRDEPARRAIAQRGQQWCRQRMEPDSICRAIWRLAEAAAAKCPSLTGDQPPRTPQRSITS